MQTKICMSFQQLKKQWYEKLKDIGFEDIEANDDKERLKCWHSHYFIQRSKNDSQKDYYQWAREILSNHNFSSLQEEYIWWLHSEGLSIRNIEKESGLSRCKIHKLIIQIKKKGL